MIKRLRLHLRNRKELKLRKWCVEKAVKAADCPESVVPTAKLIHGWIKEILESKS